MLYLALFLAVTLLWWWYTRHEGDSRSRAAQVILVARFLRSDHQRDRHIAERLKSGIENTIEHLQLGDIQVRVVNHRLLADDVSGAQRLLTRHKARLMVWGTDTGERVSINVLSPDTGRPEESDDPLLEGLMRAPGDDHTFIVLPGRHHRFVSQHFDENLELTARLVLGHLYDEENDYPAAIQALAKAMASFNPRVPPMEGLARAYFRLGWIYQVPLGNAAIAQRYYSRAIEQDPAMVEAYNNRGILRLFDGDTVGALKDFDQALTLNPRMLGALMSRATLYNQLGKMDLAIADYTRFLELAEASVFSLAARYGRASAAARLERYNEALEDYSLALEHEQDDHIRAAILYSRASAYKSRAVTPASEHPQEDFANALTDYRQALALFVDPDEQANCLMEMAVVHEASHEYVRALECVDLAMERFRDERQQATTFMFRQRLEVLHKRQAAEA